MHNLPGDRGMAGAVPVCEKIVQRECERDAGLRNEGTIGKIRWVTKPVFFLAIDPHHQLLQRDEERIWKSKNISTSSRVGG